MNDRRRGPHPIELRPPPKEKHPFLVAVIVSGFLIFGFVIFMKVLDAYREPHRQEDALRYCAPSPTDECRERVLNVDAACYQEFKRSMGKNRWSVYAGCMDRYLPGWSDTQEEDPYRRRGLMVFVVDVLH